VVLKALIDSKVLKFDYWGAKDDTWKPRKARPYKLLFYEGVWHLFAFDEEKQAERTFSLSRMSGVKITDRQFTVPKEIDEKAMDGAGSFFGTGMSGELLHYRIRFYGSAKASARERDWADDQKTKIQTDDGGYEVEFHSRQYYNILPWVLSWGADAVPLEPPELVKAWKEHIAGMVKNSEKIIKI
jgi:predicted DNA-binding transcriptional regulator YafY